MCPPVGTRRRSAGAAPRRRGLELVSGKPLDVRGTGDRLKENIFSHSVRPRDNVVRQLASVGETNPACRRRSTARAASRSASARRRPRRGRVRRSTWRTPRLPAVCRADPTWPWRPARHRRSGRESHVGAVVAERFACPRRRPAASPPIHTRPRSRRPSAPMHVLELAAASRRPSARDRAPAPIMPPAPAARNSSRADRPAACRLEGESAFPASSTGR